MVVETLKTHWAVCKTMRHGDAEQKMKAESYMRMSKKLVTAPILQKALKNVNIQPKKQAS